MKRTDDADARDQDDEDEGDQQPDGINILILSPPRATARMRKDQCTQDYVAKRTTESQCKLEIMRCLKRYVAREIYRVLEDPPLALLTNDLRPDASRCI